jgi:ATP-dependent Clp protease ATP-binding subunit ClpX
MAIVKNEKVELYCDFCGKHQDFVKMIVSGRKAHICDECANVVMGILQKEEKEETP